MENTTCPMCNLDYSKQTISMLRSLQSEGENLSPQAQHIYDRFIKIRDQYSMRSGSIQRMYNAGSCSTENPEFFIKRYDSGSEVGIGSIPKVTASSESSQKQV